MNFLIKWIHASDNRTIGLSLYRCLLCFLIIRAMFMYMSYGDLLFGTDSIAPMEKYYHNLEFIGLGFLKHTFEIIPIKIYLWVTILAAFLFALSVLPWWSGFLLFFLIFNLQLRNGLILDGSDNVILVTLPFLILADSYRYFGLNSLKNRFWEKDSIIFLQKIAVLGFILQVCTIYFVTGIVKAFCDTWQQGVANYYILQLHEFEATKWNILLANQPFFVKTTTYLSLIFEILFPLVLLNRYFKWIWLCLGVGFHLGIWIFMKIDVFPWIMIATYFVFLTDEEYRRFKVYALNLYKNGNKTTTIMAIGMLLTGNQLRAQSIPTHEIDSLVAAHRQSNRTNGVIVGVISGANHQLLPYGIADIARQVPISDTTTFEIGSLTKTFTTYLVAEAVAKKQLQLTDKISTYITGLSPSVSELSIAALCTHTSGLPENPKNLIPNQKDPTSGYTTDKLFDFLKKYRVSKTKKGKFLYSNTGFMLLGCCLERATGQPISALLVDLMNRLDLKSNVKPYDLDKNLAIGYESNGQIAAYWRFEAFLPAGGMHASGQDMLKYLMHCMKLDEPIAAQLLKTQFENEEITMALGWIKLPLGTDIVGFWHNGGTSGFASYMMFIPRKAIGIVVLANSENEVDELAKKILNKVLKAS